MKLSLYEGRSKDNCELLMTGSRKDVLARKKERDISRRPFKRIRRWTVEVSDSEPDHDKGKGGSMWANYDNRITHRSAKLVKNQ